MSDQATSAADISLAADFTTPSQQDWEKEVLKVLNRKRPEGRELDIDQAYKRLTSTTVDGLTIKPLYTIEDGVEELGYPGVAPFVRGTTVRTGEMDAWEVAQLHENPDVTEARRDILNDLERGNTAAFVRVGVLRGEFLQQEVDAGDAFARSVPEIGKDLLLEPDGRGDRATHRLLQI